MSEGGRIELRAYIEGVRVPISSATVSEGIGAITQASLNLPYHGRGRRLHERDIVHVFYRDTRRIGYARQPISDDEHPNYAASFQEQGRFIQDPAERSPFQLFFWGEIAGRGRSIATSKRSLSLTCLGFSNYLDAVKLCQALRGRGTFTDTELHLVGVDERSSGTRELFTSNEGPDTTTVNRTGRYATADLIVQYMRENGGDLQRGLRSLITELMDKTNRFYRNRQVMLRLADMLRAIEHDTTSEELFDIDLFRRFLRERLGALNYMFSIRDVLNVFSNLIFHDFVEHPSPTYFPILSEESTRILDASDVDENLQAINRERQSDKVTSWVFKPELWWTAPPACNILFPNHFNQVAENDRVISEPTRTVLKIQPGARGDRRTIADDYFAPDLEALNQLALGVPEADQDRFLLPHEKFRGIVSNVVLINELGRLVGREESQPYLRSYAQFLHWRTSYANRSIQVLCPHLMSRVLVGYPALLIDPDTVTVPVAEDAQRGERMRLGRELALLRRALRLLEALLRRLYSDLAQVDHHGYYFSWLVANRDLIEGVGPVSPYLYDLTAARRRGTEYGLYQPDPDDSPAAQAEFQRTISPSVYPTYSSHAPGGGIVHQTRRADETVSSSLDQTSSPNLEEPASSSLDNAPAEDRRERGYPRANPAFLDRYFGDRAAPVTPDQQNRIQGSVTENFGVINDLTGELTEIAAAIRSRISAVEALIEEVRAAIDALIELLRESFALNERLEHLLFYVTGKTTTVEVTEEGGSVYTNLQGGYARAYDEDIDLDGSKGDSFEGIIQTGTGGFLSEVYRPDRIGPEFYQPLYGVRSLLEVGEEAQNRLGDLSDTERREEVEESNLPTWQELIDRVYAYLQENQESRSGEGSSIALSVEAIADLYQSLHRIGIYNTDLFTESITSRPVATEADIMGAEVISPESPNFGNFQGARSLGKRPGVGFHQFSFLQEDGTFDTSGLDEGESGESQETAEIRQRLVLQFRQSLSGVSS